MNSTKMEKILNRILKENKYALEMYWDYRDELDEESIYKIVTEREGLVEVENELWEFNKDYISKEIEILIDGNLNEEDQEDEDLRDYLFYELYVRFNMNIEGLLKNSSARFRVEMQTNEDFGLIPEMIKGKGEYYNLIKDKFKGYLSIKDIKTELNEFIGSDYGRLTFFSKVSGGNILRLMEDYLRGELTINKDINGGFFNSCSGCGGMLELKVKKPITLKVNDWTEKQTDKLKKYYELNLILDSVSYGIQETYYLTSECWKEY